MHSNLVCVLVSVGRRNHCLVFYLGRGGEENCLVREASAAARLDQRQSFEAGFSATHKLFHGKKNQPSLPPSFSPAVVTKSYILPLPLLQQR